MGIPNSRVELSHQHYKLGKYLKKKKNKANLHRSFNEKILTFITDHWLINTQVDTKFLLDAAAAEYATQENRVLTFLALCSPAVAIAMLY